MNVRFESNQVLGRERLIPLLIGLIMVLIAFTAGAGLVAGQESVGGNCPLIEAIDDIPLETPQVDPDCQSNALTSPLLAPEADNIEDWTSVGSAGTVDEADTNIVLFNDNLVTVLGGVPLPATLNIRYNVVATDGLYTGLGDAVSFRARFRDTGAGTQVIARLRRYNLNTGGLSTLLTLDSNSWPASAVAQTRSVANCEATWGFDFQNYAYFFDVTLSKTAAGLSPTLHALHIGNPFIC